VKELRAALISNGIYKQREKYTLDTAVYIHSELSHNDANKQRSGDASEDEAANLDSADEVAHRNRYEECEQWFGCSQAVQKVHICLSDAFGVVCLDSRYDLEVVANCESHALGIASRARYF
jgi:hypothetical protein